MAATLIFVGGLGACASAEPAESAGATLPLMSQPTTPGFPDLRSVPQTHAANTDAGHWGEVRADMMAALADLRDNPRAVYGAPPEDPALFLEDARQDLIATRDSH
ncbi:MAG: hypothetical protein NW206_16515 [Hyphomonadaceae bacterium]|nr:hypothetical protein [Hyphomonadaceae bacterium]